MPNDLNDFVKEEAPMELISRTVDEINDLILKNPSHVCSVVLQKAIRGLPGETIVAIASLTEKAILEDKALVTKTKLSHGNKVKTTEVA